MSARSEGREPACEPGFIAVAGVFVNDTFFYQDIHERYRVGQQLLGLVGLVGLDGFPKFLDFRSQTGTVRAIAQAVLLVLPHSFDRRKTMSQCRSSSGHVAPVPKQAF